jgi:hypothetical protein
MPVRIIFVVVRVIFFGGETRLRVGIRGSELTMIRFGIVTAVVKPKENSNKHQFHQRIESTSTYATALNALS